MNNEAITDEEISKLNINLRSAIMGFDEELNNSDLILITKLINHYYQTKDMRWRSIEDKPLDHNHRLFLTKSGAIVIDRIHPKQLLVTGEIHWEERPNNRYVKWMPLPTNKETTGG